MICFYHVADADGQCSGAVVAHATGDYNSADYIGINYGNEFPVDGILPTDTVYIVDLSFTVPTMNQLDEIIARAQNVVWIDHHKSSIELEKKYPKYATIEGIRDSSYSAAYNVWRYFHPEAEVPLAVRLVSDHDTWQHKMKESVPFNYAMQTVDTHPTSENWRNMLYERGVDKMITAGQMIEQYANSEKTHYRDSFSYESEFEGYKCIVVNRKSNSLIFGDWQDKYPLMVVWVFDGSEYSYSLYSEDKSVDCSKLAEKYGGGGHAGAAGFMNDKLLVRKM